MTTPHPTAEQRAAHIEAQIDELVRVLAQTGDERWAAAADGSAWSGAEVCGHIAELMPYWAITARALAANPGQTFGRSEEDDGRIGAVRAGAVRTRQESIEQLRAAAGHACALLRALPDDAWHIRGISRSRGPMTVAEIIDLFIIAHLEEHIEQVHRAVR